MGASQVEIYNLALGNLGDKTVSLPNENSPQALALTRAWDSARRETLSANQWSFANVIESLAELANYTVPPGWVYAYQFPAKSVRIWKVLNQYSIGVATDYSTGLSYPTSNTPASKVGEDFRVVFDPTLNSKVILSNTPNAYAEYSYDVLDTTLYDPSFVSALSYRLAAAVAMTLTGDQKLASNMMTIFNNYFSDSQRLASYERQINVKGSGSILDSRA